MMGEKLLRSRKHGPLEEHVVTDIIDKLTSQLFYHGHPINRNEARTEIGLSFVEDPAQGVEDAMWRLFEAYQDDLKLDLEYNPMLQAIAQDGILEPADVAAPTVKVRNSVLAPVIAAVVESAARSDIYEIESEVTLRRDAAGVANTNWLVTKRGWRVEDPPVP